MLTKINPATHLLKDECFWSIFPNQTIIKPLHIFPVFSSIFPQKSDFRKNPSKNHQFSHGFPGFSQVFPRFFSCFSMLQQGAVASSETQGASGGAAAKPGASAAAFAGTALVGLERLERTCRETPGAQLGELDIT